MRQWQRRLRAGIIRSSRVRWVSSLYRHASRLATWVVGRRLASMSGVEAVYTRHSHPRSATFAPGQSDLDLTIVLSDDASRDATLVRACSNRVDALSGVVGFVFPQDARLVARRELAQVESSPGGAEILSTPAGWIRIGGHEVRQAGALSAIEGRRIPLHPEFNEWWFNLLQTHVLTPQADLAEGHMRLCFRVAMKSQLHLQVARGRIAPPTDGYLSDAAASALFADDSEMSDSLGDLARNIFWAPDGEERKARILHRSLGLAGEFYRDLPVFPDATWVTPGASPSAAMPEAHRSELRARLGGDEAICAIAASIIVYPTPHWTPFEYQVDVILKDDVALAAFSLAVSAIKRSFGGRTFGIGGTHAQLTLVPRRAFEHPAFFLGTPFPFLHEHVATFAETLVGAPPQIPTPPSRVERLRWCAQYFLFHRFTLKYRPHYVSKDCNFCQLAALRLFLEYDVVLTDGAQVQHAYADAFVKRDEDRKALHFLMRGNDGLPGDLPFAAALGLLSREYDSIESLLHRHGAFA